MQQQFEGLWVDAKTAAAAAGTTLRTMHRWCEGGHVRARRLAAGLGPWRVLLGPDGLPMDGTRVCAPRATPARRKPGHQPSRRPRRRR